MTKYICQIDQYLRMLINDCNWNWILHACLIDGEFHVDTNSWTWNGDEVTIEFSISDDEFFINTHDEEIEDSKYNHFGNIKDLKEFISESLSFVLRKNHEFHSEIDLTQVFESSSGRLTEDHCKKLGFSSLFDLGIEIMKNGEIDKEEFCLFFNETL